MVYHAPSTLISYDWYESKNYFEKIKFAHMKFELDWDEREGVPQLPYKEYLGFIVCCSATED